MYALLNDSDQLVAGQPVAIYRKPGPVTVGDLQLPPNWMQVLTPAEKQALHIWPMTTASYDRERYQESGAAYTYTFAGGLVTETIPLTDVALARYKQQKIQALEVAAQTEVDTPVFLTFGPTEYAFAAMGRAKELMMDVRVAVNSGMTFPANFTWSSIDYPDNISPTHEQTVVSGVTEAQFNQIVEAVLTKAYLANKKFVELREQVDNATNHAAVDAIVWT